jgi:hypothetical protein
MTRVTFHILAHISQHILINISTTQETVNSLAHLSLAGVQQPSGGLTHYRAHVSSLCMAQAHLPCLCQGSTGPCAQREQVWFSKVLVKQDPIRIEIKPRRIVFNKSSLATIVLR